MSFDNYLSVFLYGCQKNRRHVSYLNAGAVLSRNKGE